MSHSQADTLPDPEVLRAAMEPLFGDLRAFMDRRIAEVSAEVSASVQLLGMSEENLASQISSVHERIAGMISAPQPGNRTSGQELEAVVQATEAAANTILEAAEAIQEWLEKGSGSPDALPAITERVNAIFEACSFQDLTGQRIRRAIRDLQQVESILEDILPENAQPSPSAARPKVELKGVVQTVADPKTAGPDLGQDEIDRLLNG
jgi:chemotaxis protein CheZ